ncbi:hypothetical protein J6590_057354 [Homalodisca vitripennis]|nr:hypothetical protein J6590_057354 [Homalodisca vitripennis]
MRESSVGAESACDGPDHGPVVLLRAQADRLVTPERLVFPPHATVNRSAGISGGTPLQRHGLHPQPCPAQRTPHSVQRTALLAVSLPPGYEYLRYPVILTRSPARDLSRNTGRGLGSCLVKLENRTIYTDEYKVRFKEPEPDEHKMGKGQPASLSGSTHKQLVRATCVSLQGLEGWRGGLLVGGGGGDILSQPASATPRPFTSTNLLPHSVQQTHLLL